MLLVLQETGRVRGQRNKRERWGGGRGERGAAQTQQHSLEVLEALGPCGSGFRVQDLGFRVQG